MMTTGYYPQTTEDLRGVNEREAGDRRQILHQIPVQMMQDIFWRDFEPSDYVNHRNCGFIPTGTSCHVCGKTLGRELPAPYSYQTDIFADDHLTCQIAGGEQVGKSYTGAMKALMILLAFLGEYAASGRAANEVAWLVGASYDQTSREFEYIKMWLGQIRTEHWNMTVDANDSVDPGHIRIKVKGGWFIIKTKSSDDERASLRMESPVFVLICEAALVTHSAYIRLRSRVGRARTDFPGYGAIIMISTFEGSQGWYPTFHGKWQLPGNRARENAASYSMPSFSNIFTYKKGEKDPEIRAMKAEMSEDEFKERILAIPSPPRGRVFDMFDTTVHILPENAKFDPDEPVLIGIDPGYSGQPSFYAVEVIQRRRLPCGQLHYQGIDEIFEQQMVHSKVCQIAINRPWWKAEVKLGVIDVVGTYNVGANVPGSDVWKTETGMSLASEKVFILPGIRRMAAMFNLCADSKCGEPVFVLSPNQEGAIAEFSGIAHPMSKNGESWPYRWATDRTGTVIGKVPEDKYCDGIRALTYLFMNQLGETNRDRSRRTPIRVKKRQYAGEAAYAS